MAKLERRQLGYAPQLDGLRAVAIAMVMLYHGDARFPGGWLGVDIFFVLSGFLITSLLANEQQANGAINLSRFWLRRIFRLTPALLGMLLGAGIWMALNHVPHALRELSYTLEYRRNFVDASNHSLPNHGVGLTWTLAMEDQFYLVWPLILVLAIKLSHRRVVAVTLALAAASFAVKVWLFVDGAPYQRMYFGPDCCADMLLIGCALGLAYTAGWFAGVPAIVFRLAPVIGLVAFAVCLVTLNESDRSLYVGPTTILAGVAALIILGVLLAPSTRLVRLFSSGPVIWVGRLSYSLYLWHYLAYLITGAVGRQTSPTRFVLGVGLAFVFACASYYLIERPGLRLKRRFEINRTPATRGTHRRLQPAA